MAATDTLRTAAFRKAQDILTSLSQVENLHALAKMTPEIKQLLKLAELSDLIEDFDFSDEEKETLQSNSEEPAVSISPNIITEPISDDSFQETETVAEVQALPEEEISVDRTPISHVADPQESVYSDTEEPIYSDVGEAIQHEDKEPVQHKEELIEQPAADKPVPLAETNTEKAETEAQEVSEVNADSMDDEEMPDSDALKTEEEAREEEYRAKKLRLAQIKALKQEENLTAQPSEPVLDSQEQAIEKPAFSNSEKITSPPNEGTYYLDFKLDLNDRIAFTQKLFDGSQADLNQAVQTLNSFKTVEQAQRYLSDLYYERNWQKAEEYAQRLWFLVENKFL